MRRTVATAVAAVLLAAAPGREVASAPDPASSPSATRLCIAGVCLGAPEEEILQKFGAGRAFPDQAPSERCYQARGKSVYVTALFGHGDPARRIAAVLLSGETVCRDAATARVGPDRSGCRGIRLFDPIERLGTVGAVKRPPGEKGAPWPDSPSEVSQFDYRCEPDQACGVMASAFTRKKTIIAVSIRKPDC